MTTNTEPPQSSNTEAPQSLATKPLGAGYLVFALIVLIALYAFARSMDWIAPPPSSTPATQSVEAPPQQTAPTSVPALCQGRRMSPISLFDNPASGLSIDNSSKRWKDYSDLIVNGQASIEGYTVAGGECFVLLSVSGIVNGNSVSGQIYALML